MRTLRTFNSAYGYSMGLYILSTIIGAYLQYAVFKSHDSVHQFVHDPWWTYFINNIVTVTIMALGIFIFSIPTVPLLVFNGIVFGASIVTGLERHLNWVQIAHAVLPHGVFEIPATIIAAGIGLKGITFYRVHHAKKRVLSNSFGQYLLVVILLFIASVMEALVSHT